MTPTPRSRGPRRRASGERSRPQVEELHPVADPPDIASFREWALAPEVQGAIEAMGISVPTPIQRLAIGPVLEGRDVIAKAETGTGKTLAFGAPMMSKIDAGRTTVLGLVLCPTRELAQQVYKVLETLGAARGVRVALVVGGDPLGPQVAELRAGAQVVVGTPGRVLDLMGQRFLSFPWTEFAVLDEADEMLEIGFLDDVKKILAACPDERQTLLFSATFPPELLRLAREHTRNPVEIATAKGVVSVESISHAFVKVEESDRARALERLIASTDKDDVLLVFCDRRIEVDRLMRHLERTRFSVKSLHGGYDQAARFRVMSAFRDGSVKVLVATDVASRGLDVSHVTHVVNFSVPRDIVDYAHRTGRTGRAGRSGRAITLVAPSQARRWSTVLARMTWPIEDLAQPPAEPRRRSESDNGDARPAEGADAGPRERRKGARRSRSEGGESDRASEREGGRREEPHSDREAPPARDSHRRSSRAEQPTEPRDAEPRREREARPSSARAEERSETRGGESARGAARGAHRGTARAEPATDAPADPRGSEATGEHERGTHRRSRAQESGSARRGERTHTPQRGAARREEPGETREQEPTRERARDAHRRPPRAEERGESSAAGSTRERSHERRGGAARAEEPIAKREETRGAKREETRGAKREETRGHEQTRDRDRTHSREKKPERQQAEREQTGEREHDRTRGRDTRRNRAEQPAGSRGADATRKPDDRATDDDSGADERSRAPDSSRERGKRGGPRSGSARDSERSARTPPESSAPRERRESAERDNAPAERSRPRRSEPARERDERTEHRSEDRPPERPSQRSRARGTSAPQDDASERPRRRGARDERASGTRKAPSRDEPPRGGFGAGL